MKIKKLLPALVLSALCFVSAAAQKPIKDLRPTVILIAIDGFRADYLEKFQPPTLNKLAREGVRAKWLIPAFPTKTFPNHYTVATGLYPENHGIIENSIYDFGAEFGMSKREEVQNPRWWFGEPVWVTAEKQGQRAAAFFFPGSETEIMNLRPTFWKTYDGKVPNETRIDTLLSWFDLPAAKRPTFYACYFSDVDDAGHDHAPDSEESKRAVLKVDENIKRLLDGLKTRAIDEQVNLIIFSDHGMAAVNERNAVFLDDYFSLDKTERILWTDEFAQIFPKTAADETEIIKNLREKIKHADCWRKSEIPARFHYRASPRIAPIVCSAEEGWILSSRQRFETKKKSKNFGRLKGKHGYDNRLKSMRALFLAHGAAFKRGKIVAPFENVDIYHIMTKILSLTPAQNDGNPETAKRVLRKIK